MGLVFEAEVLAPFGDSRAPQADARPGGRVAIKMLRSEHLDDSQVRTRFVDEGRACMRLRHPNVIRVFDVGEAEDGTPFIVMERLEGEHAQRARAAGRRARCVPRRRDRAAGARGSRRGARAERGPPRSEARRTSSSSETTP